VRFGPFVPKLFIRGPNIERDFASTNCPKGPVKDGFYYPVPYTEKGPEKVVDMCTLLAMVLNMFKGTNPQSNCAIRRIRTGQKILDFLFLHTRNGLLA